MLFDNSWSWSWWENFFNSIYRISLKYAPGGPSLASQHGLSRTSWIKNYLQFFLYLRFVASTIYMLHFNIRLSNFLNPLLYFMWWGPFLVFPLEYVYPLYHLKALQHTRSLFLSGSLKKKQNNLFFPSSSSKLENFAAWK